MFVNLSLETLEGEPEKLKYGFLLSFLKAVLPDWDHNEEDFNAEWEDLHGLVVGLNVDSHREFNGKTYENISEYAPHDSDLVPEMGEMDDENAEPKNAEEAALADE